MKKVLTWIIRILELLVIALALTTVIRSVIHMNDDHSAEALMGNGTGGTEAVIASAPAETAAPTETAAEPLDSGATDAEASAEEAGSSEEPEIFETPMVALSIDGDFTAGSNTLTLTATFSGILSSVDADVIWYLDGEQLWEDKGRLLVDNSTVTHTLAETDIPEEVISESAEIRVEAIYDGGTAEDRGYIALNNTENSIKSVQTVSITVTANKDSGYFSGKDLSTQIGIIYEGDTALLLRTVKFSSYTAMYIQLEDGTRGWVYSPSMTVSDETVTTDVDYNDATKEDFANVNNYASTTDYLVWVSLYTQKVNVYSGSQGQWQLVETFDCSTGANDVMTSIGVYHLSEVLDSKTTDVGFVSPVLVFDDNFAFTSLPKDGEEGEVIEDTLGTAASDGDVWLSDEDINWLKSNLTEDTTIVVY